MSSNTISGTRVAPEQWENHLKQKVVKFLKDNKVEACQNKVEAYQPKDDLDPNPSFDIDYEKTREYMKDRGFEIRDGYLYQVREIESGEVISGGIQRKRNALFAAFATYRQGIIDPDLLANFSTGELLGTARKKGLELVTERVVYGCVPTNSPEDCVFSETYNTLSDACYAWWNQHKDAPEPQVRDYKEFYMVPRSFIPLLKEHGQRVISLPGFPKPVWCRTLTHKERRISEEECILALYKREMELSKPLQVTK